MSDSKYTVLDAITIRPNKIVFYKRFFKNYETAKSTSEKPRQDTKQFLSEIGYYKTRAVDNNKHNFELSRKAQANIKTKISWLYQLSKTKTQISSKSGKQFSFKINFITLSLPSTQKHTSDILNSECLNQFLTECKSRFNMINYVWRLEFQKNGNAHYHIASDTYADYTELVSIWNRCINKLGYVDEYQKKFLGCTFREYVKLQNPNYKTSVKTLKKRWKKGTAFNWSTPNTVDIRAVANHVRISYYIAKYITKKSENGINPIVFEREEINTNLRLWFCSRSLSKLDKISEFLEGAPDLIFNFYKSIEKAYTKIYDYCKVIYFTSVKESFLHRRLAWLLFNNYADSVGYVPA